MPVTRRNKNVETEMPIPDYESIMLPLMQIAADANGNELQLSAAIEQLADDYGITEEEKRSCCQSTSSQEAP
jgi:restriction system protein